MYEIDKPFGFSKPNHPPQLGLIPFPSPTGWVHCNHQPSGRFFCYFAYFRPMNEQQILDHINSKLPGSLGESIGMQFTVAREGYLEATMPVDARTIQPYGILHGGSSVALAETLGSVGSNMLAGEGMVAVGLEINANHLRAVRSGLVTGKASILHKGRSTHVWDIKIFDEREHLVCVCRFTAAIVNNRA